MNAAHGGKSPAKQGEKPSTPAHSRHMIPYQGMGLEGSRSTCWDPGLHVGKAPWTLWAQGANTVGGITRV